MKHHYTNELELKSLIIRVKQTRKVDNTVKSSQVLARTDKETVKRNNIINKYIKWYTKILNRKNTNIDSSKVKRVQNKLKDKVIKLSEDCCIDKNTYERFGYVIMQMISHIMTKSQFRGYSYQDDFTSDAVYKILKYLDNFDHTKISKISGQNVSAFSYITQIIHNSFLFIILKKKKDQEFITEQMILKRAEMGLSTDGFVFDKFENKPVIEPVVVRLELGENSNLCYECMNVIEIHKAKLVDKNYKLIIEYIENDEYPLNIEDIAFIHNVKKSYKNVEIKGIDND